VLLRDRVANLIAQQWPGTRIELPNPLYEYESRRVGMPAPGKYLVPLIFSLFLLVGMGYGFATGSRSDMPGALLVGASLILSLVCDLNYLAQTVTSIGHQIESGQWDMLRLTTLHRRDILMAKFAVAQIRAWRWMAADVALRLGGAAFALGLILFWVFPPVKEFYLPRSVPVILVFFAIFVAVYVLEPLWRMRAIVALGMAVSARIHHSNFAVLAGFGLLLGLRIVQAVIVLTIGSIALPMIFYFSRWYIVPRSLDLMDLLVYFLVCLLSAGAVYAFYNIVEQQALCETLQSAFRAE
jgi:hypothetical protein